jgi:hypothetical protein
MRLKTTFHECGCECPTCIDERSNDVDWEERALKAEATIERVRVLASDYADIFSPDSCCICPDDVKQALEGDDAN